MYSSFNEVWNRIVTHHGEAFYTKTGKLFTYQIDSNYFLPSRTNYRISKNDFEKAFADVPFNGPGDIKWSVRGPAYIWAILHDPRIRQDQW